MAITSYGVNDALSNKIWAKTLTVEALKETYFNKFMGTSASSMIHRKDELSKSHGDKITFALRTQLSGDGRTENQVLEGFEESLTTYSDSLVINELVHAVRVKGEYSIDRQRVPFNMRAEAKDGLKDWFSNRFDTVMMNHLAGYTLVTDARYNGNNAILAPSTNRIVRSVGTDDASVQADATKVFTLALIDKCREAAAVSTPLIRPMRVDGDSMYCMFLHPFQVYDLRTSTSTGQWLDIQKAAMAGGKVDSNPIFDGSLGVYNNVVLHESTRVPNGISNAGAVQANTRRAIFCGAQAGAVGWGQKFSGLESHYKWVEEMFDYERELGVSAQTIWGLKKTRFNSEDFGTIVATTYAAAH